MSLKERLEKLQCHFTWSLEEQDETDIEHVKQGLNLRIQHTPYNNHSTFYALQAYLHQREGRYQEALQSLRTAEESLGEGQQASLIGPKLVISGNYAWIYYYLCNYEMVEQYLEKSDTISQFLSHRSQSTATIPDISGMIGWSLMAIGFRYGERAASCFQAALSENPKNVEFCAGLAIALYAAATRNGAGTELKKEAISKLKEVIHQEPINYECKTYLALLLEDSDFDRAQELAEDVVKNSRDPEVLRNVAQVFQEQHVNRCWDILKQAISIVGDYSLLHRDLGFSYQWQLIKNVNILSMPSENAIAAAIQAYKHAIQLDPLCIFAKIALAEVYGLNNQQAYQQEIYDNLERELPNASEKCQQAFYVSLGKFLLYKKHLLNDAAYVFVKCFKISTETKSGNKCKSELLKIVRWFERDGRTEKARDLSQLIQDSKKVAIFCRT
ncbi:interferon-induced protein with tetratricopeptide repeats 5-like [Lissotriton helveticus]